MRRKRARARHGSTPVLPGSSKGVTAQPSVGVDELDAGAHLGEARRGAGVIRSSSEGETTANTGASAAFPAHGKESRWAQLLTRTPAQKEGVQLPVESGAGHDWPIRQTESGSVTGCATAWPLAIAERRLPSSRPAVSAGPSRPLVLSECPRCRGRNYRSNPWDAVYHGPEATRAVTGTGHEVAVWAGVAGAHANALPDCKQRRQLEAGGRHLRRTTQLALAMLCLFNVVIS